MFKFIRDFLKKVFYNWLCLWETSGETSIVPQAVVRISRGSFLKPLPICHNGTTPWWHIDVQRDTDLSHENFLGHCLRPHGPSSHNLWPMLHFYDKAVTTGHTRISYQHVMHTLTLTPVFFSGPSAGYLLQLLCLSHSSPLLTAE